MSMIRCDRCSRLIDSDDDPECFVEVDNDEGIASYLGAFCEWCRDKMDLPE